MGRDHPAYWRGCSSLDMALNIEGRYCDCSGNHRCRSQQVSEQGSRTSGTIYSSGDTHHWRSTASIHFTRINHLGSHKGGKRAGHGSPFCYRGHDKRIVGAQASRCIQCRKDDYKSVSYDLRLRKYNLTSEELDKLEAIQQCQICEEFPDKPLHIDHDHVTGKVRGVLCRQCNMGIFLLKDSPNILQKAIGYINGWK